MNGYHFRGLKLSPKQWGDLASFWNDRAGEEFLTKPWLDCFRAGSLYRVFEENRRWCWKMAAASMGLRTHE